MPSFTFGSVKLGLFDDASVIAFFVVVQSQ